MRAARAILFNVAVGSAALGALLVSGCGPGKGSGASGQGTSKPTSTSAISPSAVPVDTAFSHYEMMPIETAKAARSALLKVLAQPSDFTLYLAFRRAMACGEPFFRERAALSEELYGKAGGADAGALGELDREISAGPPSYSGTAGSKVKSALERLQASFEKERARQARVPFLLPRAVYSLGEIFAGSKVGLPSRPSAVIAEAAGLLDIIEGLTMHNQAFASVDTDQGKIAGRARQTLAGLRKAVKEAEKSGQLVGRAGLVVETGKLGADVRRALGPSSDLWVPYPPAVSARDKSLPKMGGIDEPTSALTMPRDDRLSDLTTAERSMFSFAGSPLDRFARGDEAALSDEEKRGFDVLVNVGCTRCHAAPLFGVRRPPDLTPVDAPTLRGLAGTGPYFKDHSRPTLESVLDSADAGGQHANPKDAGFQKMELSAADRKALIRFLKTSLEEPKKR